MQKIKLFLLFAVFISTGYAARQPNVVLVVTDDQGYGDMSCHGNPWLKTPEMDRLHDHSVRLTDFHVDPTCSPTRAALMSGRYSTRVGVWLTYASRHHLRKDELCLAEAFRQNGYRTAIFGKWHLGDNYPFRPMDRGFEESLVHGGGMIGEVPDYWDNDYYDDVYLRNGKPERMEGYCTDVWFGEAERFIESNADHPFFLYVAANAPHNPFFVPESYARPYRAIDGMSDQRALFYGMLACIDENLGRLRQTLEEQSLDRDTIFIFLNDNGTTGGVTLKGDVEKSYNQGWAAEGYNAGMRGKKASAYDGGHRAFCFIRWPNGQLKEGQDVEPLTAHIDLMPTLVDLCDLKLDRDVAFDGVSLTELLRGKSDPFPARTLLVHHQGRFGAPVGEGLLIPEKDYAVLTEQWRMVSGELYDIKADPEQRHDVADAHPEVVDRLKGRYDGWYADVAKDASDYAPFIIDPDQQQSVLICSQNLLGGHSAYHQQHVRAGILLEDSFAVIDVEQPGRYKITLRRWPAELDLPMNTLLPPLELDPAKHDCSDRLYKKPGKALQIKRARLKVGAFDQTISVNPTDHEAVFTVTLKPGEQKIETWFTLDDGMTTAAYYQYIEPVEE